MEHKKYNIPQLPLNIDIESKSILRQVNLANKKLAELKGIALTIPNEAILLNTLSIQEAKDSSAVENIVTTHDDLYKADLSFGNSSISANTKEVQRYVEALKYGFQLIKENKIITNNHIKRIQQILEQNSAGFRSSAGTTLRNQLGEVVYTPPQDKDSIESYMDNLQDFINETQTDIDPLIKMAIIHHQFESIHPFYDGNGRTGRIINILYLVINNLLDIPILYLSRYIITNKGEYYRLIQAVRDTGDWESWILFILKGIEETAEQTIYMVKEISRLMKEYKVQIKRILGKAYSHELLNNLFNHPYTKIEFVMNDLEVSRPTASSYLNRLAKEKLLKKMKMGRSVYYLNPPLVKLFEDIKYSSSIQL